MSPNKVYEVRNHVLSMLESGVILAGQKIPPAREIAEELGISFLKVQQAVESLCQDGVLQSHSRKGTYVQADWQFRVLKENVCVYNPLEHFPWIRGMLDLVEDTIPGLRSSFAFKRGMLELRTTSHVLTEYEDYMDLSQIFEECYPDRSLFFERPFKPFVVDGKIVGIPFAFSPRVIFYNPRIFEEAGCPLPRVGWGWDEFIACVCHLAKTLPRSRIINWQPEVYLFMSFVVRAGGRLFSPEQADPVTLDSPQVRRGLQLFRDLGERLTGESIDYDQYLADFLGGKAAMHLSGRHMLDFIQRSDLKDWRTVSMPLFENGLDCTAQATDLICVRKNCTSPDLARRYVTAMMSEPVQDYIGCWKHNIPIRKSSAFKSLDLDDSRDALFATEVAKISTDFNLEPPYPGTFVLDGIERILTENIDLEAGLSELAQAARAILGLRGCGSNRDGVKSLFYTQK
jgi:ABC-type glycerol-3-phosphate transport system substrate-binding protein